MKMPYMMLFFLMLHCSAFASEAPFVVHTVREVKANKDQIFDQSGAWIAETFRSAKAVIEHKDKEAGILIGNGAVDIEIGVGFFKTSMPYLFKIKEEIKDGKFRLTFSDVKLLVDGFERPIEATNRASNEPKLTDKFNSLADSLAAYISREKSDW